MRRSVVQSEVFHVSDNFQLGMWENDAKSSFFLLSTSQSMQSCMLFSSYLNISHSEQALALRKNLEVEVSAFRTYFTAKSDNYASLIGISCSSLTNFHPQTLLVLGQSKVGFPIWNIPPVSDSPSNVICYRLSFLSDWVLSVYLRP